MGKTTELGSSTKIVPLSEELVAKSKEMEVENPSDLQLLEWILVKPEKATEAQEKWVQSLVARGGKKFSQEEKK